MFLKVFRVPFSLEILDVLNYKVESRDGQQCLVFAKRHVVGDLQFAESYACLVEFIDELIRTDGSVPCPGNGSVDKVEDMTCLFGPVPMQITDAMKNEAVALALSQCVPGDSNWEALTSLATLEPHTEEYNDIFRACVAPAMHWEVATAHYGDGALGAPSGVGSYWTLGRI